MLAESLSECRSAIPDMERKVFDLPGTLDKAVTEVSETAVESISTANSEVNKQIHELANNLGKNVDSLEERMTEQLTETLEMFGRQLAALSEKFAEDYTPITENLRNILAMAPR